MKRAIVLGMIFVAFNASKARAESLEDRVRALERAVERLEERCEGRGGNQGYWIEHDRSEIWTCKAAGRKDIFYGNGESKGLAERDAMEQCKKVSDVCRLKECSNK